MEAHIPRSSIPVNSDCDGLNAYSEKNGHAHYFDFADFSSRLKQLLFSKIASSRANKTL
jgi:hypothetical protein